MSTFGGVFQQIYKKGADILLKNIILKLCQEKGISLSKLERECGIGHATINKWDECSPNLASVKKVADYFEIPVSKLVGQCYDEI